MFRCDGGPPWVIASSPDEVRKLLANDDRGADIAASVSIAQMPDDELFGITYDDVPEELTADCDHAVDDVHGECVEDCGEPQDTVHLKVSEWCALGDKYRDRVIWEFEA